MFSRQSFIPLGFVRKSSKKTCRYIKQPTNNTEEQKENLLFDSRDDINGFDGDLVVISVKKLHCAFLSVLLN